MKTRTSSTPRRRFPLRFGAHPADPVIILAELAVAVAVSLLWVFWPSPLWWLAVGSYVGLAVLEALGFGMVAAQG